MQGALSPLFLAPHQSNKYIHNFVICSIRGFIHCMENGCPFSFLSNSLQHHELKCTQQLQQNECQFVQCFPCFLSTAQALDQLNKWKSQRKRQTMFSDETTHDGLTFTSLIGEILFRWSGSGGSTDLVVITSIFQSLSVRRVLCESRKLFSRNYHIWWFVHMEHKSMLQAHRTFHTTCYAVPLPCFSLLTIAITSVFLPVVPTNSEEHCR